ncbi:hypothetical protein QF037_005962 [Streptomyces canus]|uniref:hypothetical protein n=1 Tax=Streptomyces canus TaxID=58343 RepID=UPI00277E9008|nr:hypothetical protein [Streptomyces canus]MDQ0601617.1 hypothetical protein [Streptomyces canus]
MREENGDVMNKLKKAAAVAVMVGGLGLVGGGVASASGGHDYDDPFGPAIDNLQIVECDQTFDGGTLFTASPPVGGDAEQNIGNFCSAVNVED